MLFNAKKIAIVQNCLVITFELTFSLDLGLGLGLSLSLCRGLAHRLEVFEYISL